MSDCLTDDTLARLLDGCLPATPIAAAHEPVDQCAACRDNGIIHRALKPENILVMPDSESASGQRVKILDCGLAKMTVGTRQNLRTRSDASLGTPLYRSPKPW